MAPRPLEKVGGKAAIPPVRVKEDVNTLKNIYSYTLYVVFLVAVFTLLFSTYDDVLLIKRTLTTELHVLKSGSI